MTVEELIKKLRDYPADWPVYVDDDGKLRDPWPTETRNYIYGERDDLREKVLTAVARGIVTGDEAREWAALALTTSDIDFAMWCA